MKKAVPIVFRADVSEVLGIGHVVRCRNFVESLPISVIPHLVVSSGKATGKLLAVLKFARWDIHTLSSLGTTDDARQTAAIADRVGAKVVITDLAHRVILQDSFGLWNYHKKLREAGAPFVLSIEDSRVTRFASHVAIIWNAPTGKNGIFTTHEGTRVLKGFEYFIAHPDVTTAGSRYRRIRQKGDRILICIGGADPLGLTAQVARSLSELTSYDIRAVSPLKQKMTNSRIAGKVKLVGYQRTLATLLTWADVAIIGEGLTKFEAAIVGTPTILITQFDHSSRPIRDFLSIESALYLGSAQKFTRESVLSSVKNLLEDFKRRTLMSKAGKKAVDGRGATRIYNEILRHIL